MNVYLMAGDEVEFLGQASPIQGPGDDYVLDIPLAGTGEALRLVYATRSVLSLTEDGRIGRERVVLLSPGQTPHFLPGWEPADPSARY